MIELKFYLYENHLSNHSHSFTMLQSEVGIPQFEAQSAKYKTSAIAEVAERFSKSFLAIAQL